LDHHFLWLSLIVIYAIDVDDLSLDNCKNVNSEDEENLTSQSDEKLDDQSFDNFYSCKLGYTLNLKILSRT